MAWCSNAALHFAGSFGIQNEQQKERLQSDKQWFPLQMPIRGINQTKPVAFNKK
jgi:hypothetical protein